MKLRSLLIILILLLSKIVIAQTFTYNYVDPCTGRTSVISIPYGQNQIAVTYYGQVKSFTADDFNNGVFSQWATSVFNSYKNISPCQSVGTTSSISQAQGTSLTFISIISSISAISDMTAGVSNVLGDAVGAAQSVTPDGGSDNSDNSGNSGSSNSSSSNSDNSGNNGSSASGGSGSNGSGSSGSGSGGSGSGGSGGSGSGGSSGSNGSGSGGTGGGSGSRTSNSTTSTNSSSTSSTNSGGSSSSDKKTDMISGTSNAIQSSGSQSGGSSSKGSSNKQNGGKPSILLGSDLVGFQFKNNTVSSGGQVNTSYSSLKYDGSSMHGVMVDFNTAIEGPNITGYYAWIKPKAITLVANTVTIGFQGAGSAYNTVAFGQLRTFKKIKMKTVYMITAAAGEIYHTQYISTAAIVGEAKDFKVGKRIDLKTMLLFVYAPFVKYYNDAVLKSPYVFLPVVGTNINVTKVFRLNINFSGSYSLGNDVLNYTIMMGTKLAL